MSVHSQAAGVRELRLGLVLYGGVSLAIYMHGVTKEIHRALRASMLAEHGEEPDESSRSERTYMELLDELRKERNGTRTRIVVDTIAGSSAGGINGIFLAKALAHDLSQDALRDLWFEQGHLPDIARTPGGPLGRLTEELLERLVPAGSGVPSRDDVVKLVFALLGVVGGDDSLFDGREMSMRIYGAIDRMAPATPDLGTLMPDAHTLSLSVTVTDYGGYRRELPIADPPVLAESQHRHLLQFRYGDGRDDFSPTEPKHSDALTLAARATSSLPVVFPPINPKTFSENVPAGATSLESLAPYFRSYKLAGADPARSYFVDGGVLDNKPFAPVIKAIRERPAGTEVERYLAFLEPDPHRPEEANRETKEPKPFNLALGALSGLPRSEPILDELHEVIVRNQHVRAVRDVIETNWDAIAKLAGEHPAIEQSRPEATTQELTGWNEAMHNAAAELTRLGQPAYVRLKIASAIDSFAEAACLVCDYTDTSNQAYLVREVLREWARSRGLFKAADGDGASAWQPTKEQREFVDTFDLGFPERRLRFVIAGVNWLYRDIGARPETPSREQLDAVKTRLYDAIAELHALSSGAKFSEEVRQGIAACFEERVVTEYVKSQQFRARRYLEDHGARLDDLNARLKAFLDERRPAIAPKLYADLVRLTAGWNEKVRRDLLVRYLGFPIWDALLYPMQAMSDVAEGDGLRVIRLSPIDSKIVQPAEGATKIMGADLGHAFAFFSREARENDYLWGRLDAAERIVRLLLTRYRTETEGGRTTEVVEGGEDDPRYEEWCRRAMRAVLEEDAADLEHVEKTVGYLREQLGAPVGAGATPRP